MKKLFLFFVLACLCTSYLSAQNSTIKPDKACINCPTNSPEIGSTLDIRGNTRIEGKLNLIGSIGDSSIFIGANAGKMDNGNNVNLFIGRNTGLNTTLGNFNTFLGHESGNLNTSGAFNTYLGAGAGFTSSISTRNTYLGYGSDQFSGSDSLDRAIAIGFNAKVDCSNCAVIGGTDADTVRVGIGIAVPTERLEVDGNVKATKFIGDGSMLTNISVDDADANPTNEIQNLAQVLAEGNNANAFKIVNLSDPSNPQDAATKAYVDANDEVDDADADPNNEIQTLSDVLVEGNNANNTAIVNLADPSNPQDAATKAYVDANDEVDDADANPNNELQDLSLSGDTLNLSDDATAVDLSAFINNWTIADGRDAAFGYNNVATGDNSTAVGYNNIANTTFSSAVGYNNEATGVGSGSSAFGLANEATGGRSSAFGYANDATGERSSAFGFFNEATEDLSNAFGHANSATGDRSSAFGNINSAIGSSSSAFGYGNNATGDESSAFGYRTLSDVYGLMAVGRYNADPEGSIDTWVSTDPVFVVGNGEDFSNRSTALTILKNGNVGIGDETPDELLEVNGNVKIEGNINLIKAQGDSSIFIGANAGLNDDGTNNKNTFVGVNSGVANITGFGNTFIGESTGSLTESGFGNTFVGNQAGRDNLSGDFNTFFGRWSGRRSTTGSSNAFIGHQAGENNLTGSNNTVLGVFAGLNLVNSTRNTFLGRSADQFNNTDSLDRAIAIGFGARVNCSHCAVIGGIGQDTVRVGIGTRNPQEILNVVGNVLIERGTITQGLTRSLTLGGARGGPNNPYVSINFDNYDGSPYTGAKITSHNAGFSQGDLRFFTNNGASLLEQMRISRDGDVGIGTNDPQAKLDVNGNIKATKFIGDGSMLTNLNSDVNNWTTYGAAPIIFGFNNTVAGDSSSAVGYSNRATGFQSSAFGNFNRATVGLSSAFGYNNEATEFRSSAFGYENDATGERSSAFGYENDAIGLSSSAFGYFNVATAAQSSAFGFATLSDVYGLMAVGRFNANPEGSINTWVSTDPVFVVGNGESSINRSTALTILKNGNMGIGIDAPQAKLDVNGEIISSTLNINGDEAADNTRINFRASDNSNRFQIETDLDGSSPNDLLGFRSFQNDNILVLKGNGNVGIGTNDPQAKLDINGTARIRNLPTGGTNSVLVDTNGNLFKSSSSPNVNEQRINDLQEENQLLQTQLNELAAENQVMKARLAKIEALLSGKVEEISTTTSTLTSATLSQNAPNPFDEATIISYFIPAGIKNVELRIADAQGQIIKRIPIQATGHGQINLQANLLSAGTYSYSLVLDGQVMETKQMVLTH